jgi:aromatic ring hydroxylase
MVTIAIQDKYAEMLGALGDVQTAVDLALQRYAIEQVTAKLAELRRRAADYRARYGMDYPAFAQRTATEERYVHDIETRVSKLWEADLADWEFCYQGIQDWTQHLQQLLLES